MLLTGRQTLEIGPGEHKIAKGSIFELNHKKQIAKEDLVITFTGMVLESYPPQLEIDKIVGEYEPV